MEGLLISAEKFGVVEKGKVLQLARLVAMVNRSSALQNEWIPAARAVVSGLRLGVHAVSLTICLRLIALCPREQDHNGEPTNNQCAPREQLRRDLLLKALALERLNRTIQNKRTGHDSLEDATASRDLIP